MTQGWIFKDRLSSFVEQLAFVAGADNDLAIEVIAAGLLGTDDERDEWFDYEMVGVKRKLALRFADDPGSSVCHVRLVALETDAKELFELALLVGSSST